MQLRKVTRTYDLGSQKVTGVVDVSLEIPAGDIMAMVGPSGSGKSTLLNMISLIDEPTSGEVLFEGKSLQGLTDKVITDFRGKHIGIIFQSFNLMPVMNALENVALALMHNGLGRSERIDKAETWLKRVGLGGHLKHKPDALSGGQRQRVAIARALVAHPKMVVADEPTAALDSKTAFEIIDLLIEMNRNLGTTLVLSTHDLRIMDKVKRQIRLVDGRIAV
jgi:putative ABC transport system ATP-binding protein